MRNKKYHKDILYFFLIFSFVNIATAFSQTGSELFIENRCSRCHTIGRGRFVGPDLYDISKKYSKEQLMAWILNPEIIYSQTNKKPYNPGYPPMPQIGVTEHESEIITNFLFDNKIKKQENDRGVIRGVLINESSGNGAEGNDIYLKSFIGDRLTDEKLQITDKDGKFSFNDLSWVNSYSLKIKHEGLEYETAKMVFPPDKESIELNLPLYGTTENDSEIILNLNHQILSVGDKAVSIAEIYDFDNRSNRIFIGSPGKNSFRETLKFYLPVNAINLRFAEGLDKESIKRENNLIIDSSGFPPGRKRVVITYDIPLEYGKNSIEKVEIYDVSTLLLLVDDTNDTVNVGSLNELEPVTIENKQYKRWTGSNLTAGSKYSITITNKSSTLKYLDLFPIIIFAALFISVFIIKLITGSENKNKNIKEQLRSRRENFLRNILVLDERYKKNLIKLPEFKSKRDELKSHIAEIDRLLSNIKSPQNDTE